MQDTLKLLLPAIRHATLCLKPQTVSVWELSFNFILAIDHSPAASSEQGAPWKYKINQNNPYVTRTLERSGIRTLLWYLVQWHWKILTKASYTWKTCRVRCTPMTHVWFCMVRSDQKPTLDHSDVKWIVLRIELILDEWLVES